MTSYYSPGLFCPSNYHTCSPPPSPYALSSSSGETIAFCCPSSRFPHPFAMLDTHHHVTQSRPRPGYICPGWQSQTGGGIVYDGCNSGLSTGTQVVTVMDNIYDQSSLSQYTYTWTGVTTWWQIAWPIQIRWKESDFSLTTNSGGPLATATSNLPSGATGSTTTPVAATPSQLSGGAIAGIAVAAILAAALFFGIPAFLFFYLRRKARSRTIGQPQPPAGHGTGPGELPHAQAKQQFAFAELPHAPAQQQFAFPNGAPPVFPNELAATATAPRLIPEMGGGGLRGATSENWVCRCLVLFPV